VVYANVLAYSTTNKEAVNQVYNVAYGSSTSLNQLFDLIKSNLKSNLIPDYKAERKGDIKNSLANINKANQLLGYEPLVDLQNGMDLTINWYRNNLN
jgi:UDP-N-acetylglucosamine 4-epimerase